MLTSETEESEASTRRARQERVRRQWAAQTGRERNKWQGVAVGEAIF
jgi:hypothetical protein